MTELGTRLKEARLAKGYSLDDLQEMTKIQKRYLVAIEEGNYSIMPGSFYIRAFIKQYAEAVGLDYDQLLDNYKNELPQQPKEEVAQSISNSPARRRIRTVSSSRFMESLPKIIFALFIIVILIVIWFLWQQKADSPNDEYDEKNSQIEYDKKEVPEKKPIEKEDEKEQDANNEADKDEAPLEEEQQPTTQTISEGTVSSIGTTYEVSGIDTLKVRVEVSGDAWIEIRDKNRKPLTDPKVYKADENIEVDATEAKYARIRLGNTNNAKIFVNDQEIQLVSKSLTQNVILELKEEVQ